MRWLPIPALSLVLALYPWAQSTEAAGDRVRGMWSTEFRNARAEEAKRPAPRPVVAAAEMDKGPGATTTPVSPAKPGNKEPAMIGITVWLLRPSTADDPPAVRAIVHEKPGQPHTPVRVSSQTRFSEGDHVRLTIESGRAGYLYVVSRERYKGGSTGAQHLIFPTTRLRSGDNRVRAGFPVEIPSGSDNPSYFTIRRSRQDHIGEEILFVVAPQPISGITITESPLVLSDSLVKSWQEKWVTKVQRLEAPGSQDQPLTPGEAKLLRAGHPFQNTDPLPQTLFRGDLQLDQPLLVVLRLQMTP